MKPTKNIQKKIQPIQKAQIRFKCYLFSITSSPFDRFDRSLDNFQSQLAWSSSPLGPRFCPFLSLWIVFNWKRSGQVLRKTRNKNISWIWPPHSNSGKWRFIGIPTQNISNNTFDKKTVLTMHLQHFQPANLKERSPPPLLDGIPKTTLPKNLKNSKQPRHRLCKVTPQGDL